MPFDGSGNYVVPAGTAGVPNTVIDSTKYNTLLSDLQTALTLCVTRNGQSAAQANLPMGGFKHTGLGAGATAGDSLRWEQLFSQGAETAIVSAATLDIGAVNSSFLRVTGSTGPITSLGTNYNGPRWMRFTDATPAVLTYNATTLLTQTSANISLAQNDIVLAWPKATSTTPDGWQTLVIPAKGAALVGGLIANNLTINVPADHATVNEAFDWLRGRTIARGAVVTIKVADGTHALTLSINGNHPQGSQIRLIGNELAPALCVLRAPFPSTFDGLVVSSGHTLGYVNGFKFDLPLKAEWPNNNTGILASNGSTIVCGQKIEVNNWYYGIAARNGSFIACDYVEVNNAGDVGIWAFVGSTVYCRNAVSNNASDAANSLGFGFQAEYGSSMDCSNASATGCLVGGIASLSNSTVRAWNCTANSNTGSGFYASAQGHIENHSSTANSNTRYGEERNLNGTIIGGGVTLSGNTIAAYNPYAYFDNAAGLGARIAASGGPLRIDVDGADSMFVNTSGGAQFEVAHQASAANFVYVKGAQAGNPPTVGVSGSDAVADLYLVPKGAGSYVRFAAGFAASADAPITGYIEIKDNAGTIRKLAVIA